MKTKYNKQKKKQMKKKHMNEIYNMNKKTTATQTYTRNKTDEGKQICE